LKTKMKSCWSLFKSQSAMCIGRSDAFVTTPAAETLAEVMIEDVALSL